jgi:hypothetical protein
VNAFETVEVYDTEKRRQIYKKNLEDLDLMGKSKRLGIAEAHRSWSEDVPWFLEYKRRLSHIPGAGHVEGYQGQHLRRTCAT